MNVWEALALKRKSTHPDASVQNELLEVREQLEMARHNNTELRTQQKRA